MIEIRHGDALDVLRKLPTHSAHALVTDPPAGISFMGRSWDSDKGGRAQWVAWLAEILAEARRVLRPGAHALVWALPRTAHWTATALEDAGFDVRDVVVHIGAQGFPKSLDVSKALDKMAGAEREAVSINPSSRPNSKRRSSGGFDSQQGEGSAGLQYLTAPATDAAREWAGWGTALKPAAEHWILARVPLEGTVASNVLEHGTGALNVDGCRIATTDRLGGGAEKSEQAAKPAGWDRPWRHDRDAQARHAERIRENVAHAEQLGRWPANVILSGEAPALLDAQSGTLHTHGGQVTPQMAGMGYRGGAGSARSIASERGGASRFFYCAKASRAERGEGNAHPTVKPLELMRWLVRLITPPGGVVLDPFAGSGTTAVACELEGVGCIAIEREAEYAELARRRVRAVEPPLFREKAGV